MCFLQSGNPVMLCNACGILFKRGWHCTLCSCVYRKTQEPDNECWIPCDYCNQWTHMKCEILQAEQSQDWSHLEGRSYACPTCRSV